MPQIVAAVVAALVTTAATAAVGATLAQLAGAFVAFGIMSAFSSNSARIAPFGAAQLISNTIDPVLPQRLIYGTRRVGGQIVYRTTSPTGIDSNNNNIIGTGPFFWVIVALAGHECESIDQLFFGDVELTLDGNGFATNSEFVDRSSKLILVKKFDGSQTTADQQMINEIENWTSNHIGKGICYVAVRLQYSASKVSQVRNISAVVKGKKVFDPRSSTTGFSNNPALCIRDYLTDSKFGIESTNSEINDPSFITAANICEEQVEFVEEEINGVPVVGTFDRYTCDMVVESGTNLIDNLNFLVSTLAGSVTYVQGEFNVHAGAFTTPVVTIDESWLSGNLALVTKTARNQLFNAVKGVFIDSEQNYEATSFTPITSATFEAEDGGTRIFQNIQLRGTTNSQRAQRISRLLLRQSRQQISIEIKTNFKALEIAVYDNVNVTLEIFGFVSKVFKVVRWQFNKDGNGISMTLREEDAANYDWDVGDGVFVALPPDSSFPSPFDVSPPGAPNLVEELYVASGGSSVKTRVVVSWVASPSQFIVAYEVSYTVDGGVEVFVGRTSGLTITAFDVPQGAFVFFVKAINNIQSESEKSQNVISVSGLTDPPADIENFSLNMVNNNANLTWDLSNDLQVRVGGKVIIKWTPLLVGASWATAFNILASLPGIAQGVTVGASNGTYLIKAEDFQGNQSENATVIVSDVADLLRMNVVANSTQEPGFSGTKTNMVVVGNSLELATVTLWDNSPGLWDDRAGLFDDGGGLQTNGEYFFDSPIDIGRVTRSRISVDMEAVIFNESDVWDDRQGLWDDQTGSWDGGDEDVISTEIFVRTTDDDSSGSPVWSEYRRFVVGDYEARAFDFKIVVTSKNSAFNINISKLQVNVDMPDVVDSGQVVTSASGPVTVNYAINFFAVPDVGATIIDSTQGIFGLITNQTNSSFDIEVRKTPSNPVSVTVNWLAKGF